MNRRLFLFGLTAPVAAACGAHRPVAGPSDLTGAQRGLASWYGHGDGTHGKLTASASTRTS